MMNEEYFSKINSTNSGSIKFVRLEEYLHCIDTFINILFGC